MTATKRSGRATGAGTGSRGRVSRTVADQLGNHAADAAAIALIVLGVLCGLGVFSDTAGPVGSALDSGATALVGAAAVALPFLLGAAGVLILFRPKVEAPLRLATGALLSAVASVCLLHLAKGAPELNGGVDGLRDAGGLVGAVIAVPLSSATGTAGAVVVLVSVGLLGLLLMTGLPMRDVLATIGRGVRALWRQIEKLFRLGSENEAGDDGDDDEALWISDEPLEEDLPVDDEPTVIDLDDPESAFADESFVDDQETGDEDDAFDGGATEEGIDVVPMADVATTGGSDTWHLPPLDLLEEGRARVTDARFAEEAGQVLERTLADFGVDATLIGMTVGPTVTRYELELASGVKVNKIRNLNHDIAYAMASPDVRILAPIPGRSAIGVEVPNRQRQVVTLGEILGSDEAAAATHPLQVGLGRDIAGRAVMANLAEMPHVLIAGATGAGKSSCINSIVTSILARCTPEEVRLILVDPKRVELGAYNDLPHLLTSVVTDPKKAANALDWAVREMDMRYEMLATAGYRDIAGYNAAVDSGELTDDEISGTTFERLPFIVVIVDELNDLMMVAARDVEASICRIAQMARAVGIHLVIATQRPSVDVITGVIKANVPSRFAFSVTSSADSRVILDQMGAEKLVGQGDMLVMTASESRAQRVQGSWVTESEVRKVVAHWKRQADGTDYVAGIAEDKPGEAGPGGDDDVEGDELFDEALDLVVRSGLGSTSMLQRKLRVGFARAGRLMDLLERRGIVGPSEGSKARAVLMTVDELDEMRERV